MLKKIHALVFIFLFSLTSCASKTAPSQRRTLINKESSQIVSKMKSKDVHVSRDLANAYGYATFGSYKMNLFLLASGSGDGVAVNRRTGKRKYMKMTHIGVGVGVGVKEFNALMIFRTKAAYDLFLRDGFDFSGDVDAAAKTNKDGLAMGMQASVQPDVKFYVDTEQGFALQATVGGTKYWPDSDLN